MKKISIKSQIIISFVALIIMLLVGQIVFNLFLSKQYFINQNQSEALSLFNKIKSSYTEDTDELYELTKNEDMVTGFSIQISSKTELIYASRNPGLNFNGTPNRNPFSMTFKPAEYSETPEAKVFESHKTLEHQIILKGKFFFENDYRYITITKPIESIEASVDIFTRSSIIISLVILSIGLVVIIIIAKSISSPIRSIEIVSQNLSKLDFSYRANEKTSIKELSSLAQSVNSMSFQLNKSMSELQTANIKLLEDIELQKKQEKSRKEFIANISHEMKTPLALLQLYCENLKSNIEEIDKDEYCDIIIEETQRLDTIVKDMLNISSIENGLLKTEKEDFNFSKSCSDIVNTLSPFLEKHKLIVNIFPHIHITADKKQIEEAMRNYIMNAVSHTKENATIKISLTHEQNHVVFSVYNDGEKISEKDLEHIWESFYKSDKSRTRKISTNAGLGLYIVKIIMQNHGGDYKAENIDDGVRFSFLI